MHMVCQWLLGRLVTNLQNMLLDKYSSPTLWTAIQAWLLSRLKILLSLYLFFILTVGGLYNILAPFNETPDYHKVFLLFEQFSYPSQYYHSKRYLEIFIYYGWAIFDITSAGLALLMLWRPIQIENKWLLSLPFVANTSIFFTFA